MFMADALMYRQDPKFNFFLLVIILLIQEKNEAENDLGN